RSYQRVLIKQEYNYQDYSTQELTNKKPNLESEEQSSSKGLEMKAEEMTEYKCMPASYNKNSNPTTTDICTVGHQNTDCSEDCSKLTKTESEIQYKKAVHIFTILNVLPSEASLGRELFETDLTIHLGTINEDINKEDLTRLCKKKVVIDRVIVKEAEEDEPSKLVHEEEKVLDMVKSYFEKQFYKQDFLEDKMPSN
ncbi:2773_t:CDS:2, partial [Gigaspora margarita]